jgi:hypothetical protein
MRGAPQSGFSLLIRRIKTRSSVLICAVVLPVGRDFQRQLPRNPALWQRTSISDRMIVSACRIDGNQRYSWLPARSSAPLSYDFGVR